jgi:hypothetical protein
MRKIRLIPLLLAALLLFACGKTEQPVQPEAPEEAYVPGADDVVLTVGDEPVYASVYRYHLNDRYGIIREYELYDREKYLSYVSNPNINYLYAYYDTRTEEGMNALCEDVLHELALEAAAIDTGTKAGYQLDIAEQSYLKQAEDDAEEKLSDQLKSGGGTYESREAFLKANGFTEERYTEMFVRSMKAGMLYNHILTDYKATHTLTDEELETGYARVVKETFTDRYTPGMYSQYLYHYLTGSRTFPSLYIPENAIFVRLFAKTEPTDEQIEAYRQQAETDFEKLYASSDNEFASQGIMTDLAVAENDELFEGLYNAAKDVPVGGVGTLTIEKGGKRAFYLFLRVEGETGTVPIDRYPGVRERIVNQLLGAQCMNTLREKLSDPAYTVRNAEMIEKIRPGE